MDSRDSFSGGKRHRALNSNRNSLVIFFVMLSFNWLLVTWKDNYSMNEPRELTELLVVPESTTATKKKSRRRLAVAQFIDSPTHLYGAYSIHTQMQKFNMTQANDVSFVAVVPDEFPQKHKEAWDILNEWFHDVQLVDKTYIHKKVQEGLWKGTFNKLWLFNLTNYDKVIVLDADILIRRSIMHWFDYATPCATQPVGQITWNSGAMVISPNATIFEELIKVLPQVQPFNNKNIATDNWNTWVSDQGFLSAFFTQQKYLETDNPIESQWVMKTMPIQASILTGSKGLAQSHGYWTRHRRHIFETVHMTSIKPWDPRQALGTKNAAANHLYCDVLREWKESIEGLEKYYPKIEPIPVDFLRNCPKVQVAKGESKAARLEMRKGPLQDANVTRQ